MRFVLASNGTRGDIEPCAAVGRELLHRGHDVQIAVQSDMLDFVESAGLAAVTYGTPRALLHDPEFVRKSSTIHNPISALPEVIEKFIQLWMELGTTLVALANGADLLLTAMTDHGLAANVAEYYKIPLATLHPFPAQFWSSTPLLQFAMKKAEAAQRRALGLPEATGPAPQALEIQAYDALCFPGLATEGAEQRRRQLFVGALTCELPTDADEEVLSWIATGTPPIYFGFGSTPVASPADMVATISAACTQLGERALICLPTSDFTHIPHVDHVKVAGMLNYAAIFPACRAVVHHGGAGTTAASLRAGIPTLILWTKADQPVWADAVTRLKVGCARQFSATTPKALVTALRLILAPQYAARAREVADHMSKPVESIRSAADLLEDAVRSGRLG
ncbi:MAG: glycosyltransferase [Mycobacterium sp.]|nr:glycosyltransferase [Mycobacterium sp.]